ncbi:hypothetical protein J2D73_19105 [Acetobacter sacchari]|uniref:Uncharacterized protein n=1 Tax=Acetobacter sacchari TaxID=2661687 RepID=A0ABS3M179_9PROT|nr:hypothetical protein [Acetobacter sacchari]MBO1361894.1 hypothetical protein [Acetobacter sacchari]
MSLQNRVTLEDFEKMSASDASHLPPDMLFEIEGEVIELDRRSKDLKCRLSAALNLKYGDTADGERKGDYGKVRIVDAGFVIECNKPKSVDWDSDGLRAFAKELAEQGERTDEYLKIEISVPEQAYKNWPSGLRAQVDPFRTEKAGKPTYKMFRG